MLCLTICSSPPTAKRTSVEEKKEEDKAAWLTWLTAYRLVVNTSAC